VTDSQYDGYGSARHSAFSGRTEASPRQTARTFHFLPSSGYHAAIMSEETALLKAIIADPDDDTSRLVYADWLDEHDQPNRAEFIRVQIGLARGTPSGPDYPDLVERWEEINARVSLRLSDWEPEWPAGVRFYGPMHDIDDADWHRGFPELVDIPNTE